MAKLSAKQRQRKEARRYALNTVKKASYKQYKRLIKKSLIGGGSSLDELVGKFQKAVDKAAKSGVIHNNKAAREKARVLALISGQANKASESSSAPTKRKSGTTKARAAKKSTKGSRTAK